MNKSFCFNNGAFLPLEEMKISILDLAVLRGYAVFEYLRTYNGKPFRLDDHLNRFYRSAKGFGIEVPYEKEKLDHVVKDLLDMSGDGEKGIRLLLTGGKSDDYFLPTGGGQLFVMCYPFEPFPQECYEKGIHAITMRTKRPFPELKTTQYAEGICKLGKHREAKEALYVNEKNEILEGTTSNFFGIKKGELYTAKEGILKGMTRSVTLELAKDHLAICEKALSYDEISLLDEAFITSSNRKIMPVVAIDSQIIANGFVGNHTQQLMHQFDLYTQGVMACH